MPKIGRQLYHEAMRGMISEVGYQSRELGIGRFLVYKGERTLYLDVAGKNLPYLASGATQMLPWETALDPDRLDRIDSRAAEHAAEAWVALCYAILEESYLPSFSTIVTVGGIQFGARLLTVEEYRDGMKPRSPSWGFVDLPREEMPQLTRLLEDI
jgi:hypothetical protein